MKKKDTEIDTIVKIANYAYKAIIKNLLEENIKFLDELDEKDLMLIFSCLFTKFFLPQQKSFKEYSEIVGIFSESQIKSAIQYFTEKNNKEKGT